MTIEMIEVTTALAETYVWNSSDDVEVACNNACAHCPYKNICSSQEIYFGCAVWEESMEEDL